MFSFANASEIMRIGERNAEAVRVVLNRLGISVLKEDTGGNYGRTVELFLETGIYRIKSIDHGEKEL